MLFFAQTKQSLQPPLHGCFFSVTYLGKINNKKWEGRSQRSLPFIIEVISFLQWLSSIAVWAAARASSGVCDHSRWHWLHHQLDPIGHPQYGVFAMGTPRLRAAPKPLIVARA